VSAETNGNFISDLAMPNRSPSWTCFKDNNFSVK
jgi:hypothetical protein